MTLQQIHYAITISEQGSFNKASEILYISQPSLTESVRELEKELNISIFHRSGRGVTLTSDGMEFISYARELYRQYEVISERYGENGKIKKKFAVSTQHYSFAVKSFVELVKQLSTDEYEFAIREVRTQKVIDDVSNLKSEIGVLYLSDFNLPVITKLFRTNKLEFHELIACDAYVYLWKGHPLAHKKSIRFDELTEYPTVFQPEPRGEYDFKVKWGREYKCDCKSSSNQALAHVSEYKDGAAVYPVSEGFRCDFRRVFYDDEARLRLYLDGK